MMKVEPREIRAMLQQRLPDLLAKLFPHYRVTFPVMTPRNPTRDDKHAGSFVVWTAGAAAGGFNEYSPRGPACSGDVIDLIAYVNGRAGDRRFALAFARDFLGLETMDAAALTRSRREARAHASQVTAAQSEQIAGRIKKANALWMKSLPIAGSVAETYLASRRIPLAIIRHREDDLRFVPRLEWWKGTKWDRSTTPWTKLEEGPHLPAMIAAMRNLAGDITAVHCTFLRLDGSGKADVAEPKLIRGLAKGAAIRLTRGDADMDVAEAIEKGVVDPLIVSEGIENGLSLALGAPEARVWAAGSFRTMLDAPVEPDIFDPLVFGLDNDDDPKAADAIADRIDALREAGKRVGQMRAHAGKDFNELVQA